MKIIENPVKIKRSRSPGNGFFRIVYAASDLLRLLERFQLGFRTDHKVVVIAQARTAGDQVTADDIFLEVFQRIDLGLDRSLVEHLGGLLE